MPMHDAPSRKRERTASMSNDSIPKDGNTRPFHVAGRTFPMRHWKGPNCVNYLMWDASVSILERIMIHQHVLAKLSSCEVPSMHPVQLVVVQDPSHPACGQYGLTAQERISEGAYVVCYTGIVQTQIRMPTSQRFTIALGATTSNNPSCSLTSSTTRTNTAMSDGIVSTEKDSGLETASTLLNMSFTPIPETTASPPLSDLMLSLPPHAYGTAEELATFLTPEIDAEYVGNLARFANDPRSTGRRANLLAVQRRTATGQIYTALVAARQIEAGEELLLAYGPSFSLTHIPAIGPAQGAPLARVRGRVSGRPRMYVGTGRLDEAGRAFPLESSQVLGLVPRSESFQHHLTTTMSLWWTCPQCATRNHLPTHATGIPAWKSHSDSMQRVPPRCRRCTYPYVEGATLCAVPVQHCGDDSSQHVSERAPTQTVRSSTLSCPPVHNAATASSSDISCRTISPKSPSSNGVKGVSSLRLRLPALTVGVNVNSAPVSYAPVAWPRDFLYAPWMLWHPLEPLEYITALSPHISQAAVCVQELTSGVRDAALFVTREVCVGERICFCGGILAPYRAHTISLWNEGITQHSEPEGQKHRDSIIVVANDRTLEGGDESVRDNNRLRFHLSFSISTPRVASFIPQPKEALKIPELCDSSAPSMNHDYLLTPTNEVRHARDVARYHLVDAGGGHPVSTARVALSLERNGELTVVLEATRHLAPGSEVLVDSRDIVKL